MLQNQLKRKITTQDKKLTQLEQSFKAFNNSNLFHSIHVRAPLRSSALIPGQTQIFSPPLQQRRGYQLKGSQFLLKNEVALIILAGGLGLRYGSSEGKQFIVFENLNLLQIALKTIIEYNKKHWRVKVVYIVCNRRNSGKILDLIQTLIKQFNEVLVLLAEQTEIPSLNEFGYECIYKNEEEKLTCPSGIGTFLDARIYFSSEQSFSTIEQHLQLIEARYVYCIGAANLSEKGIDPLLVGIISENKEKLSMVFKCISPDPINRNLPRACIAKQNWLVMEYESLMKISGKKEFTSSPIWINNFIFDKFILGKGQAGESTLKYQFLERTLKVESMEIKLLLPEVLISQYMGMKAKCLGVLCKDDYFPIIYPSDFQKDSIMANSPLKIEK